MRAKPFVKWAGGKRQLLEQFRQRGLYPLGQFNPESHTYYEPFVGGGAVFFELQPPQAVISDLNYELITAYRVIQHQVEDLIDSLRQHRYDKDYYLAMRAKDVRQLSLLDVASRFIYLNRTGFNGLYRVNKAGQFNVPFGRYHQPLICDAANLRRVNAVLQGVTILQQDYLQVLESAQAGDFIYFDPPYYPLNRTASFTAYTATPFLEKEHRELRDCAVALSQRGCYVMLSNSDTPFIRDLYEGLPSFRLHQISASRAINAQAAKRGRVNELVICNY